MTLNETHIRELLEHATPGPWHVAMLDLHRETGVIDNEHAQANQRLAALAPELAAEVIRLREELTQWQEAARDMQTLGKADIPITKMWEYINDRIARILEGDSQND